MGDTNKNVEPEKDVDFIESIKLPEYIKQNAEEEDTSENIKETEDIKTSEDAKETEAKKASEDTKESEDKKNTEDKKEKDNKKESSVDAKTKKSVKKNRKKVKIAYNICMFVFAAIFIGCAIYLINYFWQSKKSEDKVSELKELVVEETTEMVTEEDGTPVVIQPVEFVEIDGINIQAKFAEIYKLNKDFIGWIKIDDTEIDYPVMQTMADEEFYIHRDFDKEYSSAGTLFIDTDCSVTEPTDNIVIYGHNMKTGKMFHDLLEYESEEFYKEHKYITFDTIYENGTYEVIAAYRTEIFTVDYTGFKYYYFFDADTKEEFDDYVQNSKALTYYDIPATAEYGDTLLTLSTCAYHTEEGRFVVVARKID